MSIRQKVFDFYTDLKRYDVRTYGLRPSLTLTTSEMRELSQEMRDAYYCPWAPSERPSTIKMLYGIRLYEDDSP